ncbi:helix-turn-helix domain-containing protein (plasmid) [Leptospira sp. WS60.C2]
MFDIFLFIIFSGIVISLLGIGGALVDNQSAGERLLINLLFLFIGMVQISYYVWFLGVDNRFLLLHSTHLPFATAIGPLFYIFLQIILGTYKDIGWRYVLHFSPAILVTILIIPYILLPDSEKISIIEELNLGKTTKKYAIIIGHIRIFIFLQIFVYLFHFLYKTRALLNIKSFRRLEVTSFLFIIILCSMFILSFSICGMYFFEKGYYVFSHKTISISISFLVLSLYLITRKYPKTTMKVKREFDMVKYENSNLKNLNLDKIRTNLDILIEEKKIYKENELSMDKLSNLLGIGVHQLSQYLNEILKTKFYDFINHYRIIESEKLLINESNRTVLSIALEVGFNSESTFYSAFKKKWKMSPKVFRKKFRNK